MKMLLGAIMAAVLVTPALAAPGLQSQETSTSPILKVAEGCGRGWIRDRAGYCVPEGGWGNRARVCPPGYHLGPEHERCWPN